jgi:hypothetical protein
MQLGQQGKALASGGAAFLRDFEPTQIGSRPDGSPIYSAEDQAKIDLRDAFEEAKEFNLSPTSVSALVSGISGAIQNLLNFTNN